MRSFLPGDYSFHLSMLTVFKKYAIGALGITAFLLLSLWLLPVAVSIEKYTPQLESMLTRAFGRQVNLGKDLDISLFPTPGISVSDFSLGNPVGFAPGPFLQAGSVEARIRFLPLLTGEISISRLVLGSLKLDLQRSADGRANWAGPEDPRGRLVPSWLAPCLRANLLAVTDGRVEFLDQQQQRRYALPELMVLLTEADNSAGRVVEVQTKVADRDVQIVGGLTWDAAAQDLFVVKTDLEVLLAKTLTLQLQGQLTESAPYFTGNLSLPNSRISTVMQVLQQENSVDGVLSEEEMTLRLQVRREAQEPLLTGELIIGGEPLLLHLSRDGDQNAPYSYSVEAQRLRLGEGAGAGIDLLQEGKVLMETFGQLVARNGRLSLHAPELFLAGVSMEDFSLRFTSQERSLLPRNFTAGFYGGRLQGAVSNENVDDKTEVLTGRLEGLQLGALVEKVTGSGVLTGTAAADFSLSSSCQGEDVTLDCLELSAELVANDGDLAGAHLLQLLAANGQQQEEADDRAVAATPYKQLELSLQLVRGRLTIVAGQIHFADKDVELTGWVDVPGRNLNLAFAQVAAKHADRPQEGTAASTEPVFISGPWNDLVTGSGEGKMLALAAAAGGHEVSRLVDAALEIASPEEVSGLVGKSLVDPSVVVHRFALAPVLIGKEKEKVKREVGSGRIRVKALEFQDSFSFE